MDGPAIHVTDTRTGGRHRFEPATPGKVRMYVCGLTPYDQMHAGHARAYVAFDLVRRWLEHRGHDVVHIQNVTDVDDRILARAAANKEHALAFSKRMHGMAETQLARLRVLHPHHLPKVSDHIQHIVELTQRIIERGHAYAADGSVYFDVASFPRYGELSKIDREALIAEHRKEASPGKRSPADFALWKAAKPGEALSWPSPWGPGRPGWHIECSAMATAIAGPVLDIHGGGRDLAFPHHENEIAQSEAATGVHPFVKYWLHAGFLTVEGEKMSKSLGNFITAADLLERHRAEAVRLLLAGTHYRSPIDFSWKGFEAAERALDSLLVPLHRVRDALKRNETRSDAATPADVALVARIAAARDAFGKAMDDDFDTPAAIAQAHTLATALNAALDMGAPHADVVRDVQAWYAFLDETLAIVPATSTGGLEGPALDLLLELRQELRAKKDFALSDRIRDRLKALGVVIEDTPAGARWRKT